MTHTAQTVRAPRDPNMNLAAGARSRRRNSNRGLMLWLLPGLIVFGFVTIVPGLRGVFFAFTDWNGLSASYNFVGFENFVDAFTDPLVLSATLQTLFYAVVITVAETVLGLLLAVGLTSGIRTRNILRVILFTPFVVTPIVMSFLWKYIYTPSGPLDQIVNALGWPAPDWLGDPDVAKWSVAVSIIWQLMGLSMVIYIAALQSIPEEVIEAAHIDGASAVKRFWNITLPMVRPATTIVVVLTMITCIKLFDQVWVLTQGGPGNSTQTLSTALYQKAFTFGDFGTASVIAIIVAVLGLAISLVQYKVLERRGGKES